MHVFDPELSMKDNYLKADDLEFAAWDMVGHEHREQYRDSGNDPKQSAWLRFERMKLLQERLTAGELWALGVDDGDPKAEIQQIPISLFLSPDLHIDDQGLILSALGRTYMGVRVCRVNAVANLAGDVKPDIVPPAQTKAAAKAGRPNQLAMIHEAWLALKAEIPGFLEMAKSTQNSEIQERLKANYPSKFPGKAKIGDSTIRRHRRENPKLFD